jgi:SAM-dependent methyltransferase
VSEVARSAHEVAEEFCRLVQVQDLFDYLGLARDASADEAKEALGKKRRYMQGMQSNPKFKDSAKFLIKNYRYLEEVLDDPSAHLRASQSAQEQAKLPMLEFALAGVLSDGVLSVSEEAFLRTAALELGIAEETYERVLEAKAAAAGVEVPRSGRPKRPELRPSTEAEESSVSPEAAETARLRAAEGHGWWDAAFTRLLLEAIPGGPGEMVDVYCRTGLSASTLLPERPQLTWLGVDRSSERLAAARAELTTQAGRILDRVTLSSGEPHTLPLGDESVDYVLAIRALAHQQDTRSFFREAARVLRPGGRLLVAEPDGFAETFHFDGHLVDYNSAFRDLCVAADRHLARGTDPVGRPGLSIGSTLFERMQLASLVPTKVRVHASNNLSPRPFGRMARRLRRYPEAVAKAVGLEGSTELRRVYAAVDDLEARVPKDKVGMSGHVLPMILAVGEKE